MQRPLSRLQLCFICAALAQGVGGILCATRSTSLGLSDIEWARDGFYCADIVAIFNSALWYFREEDWETASGIHCNASVILDGTRSKRATRTRSLSLELTVLSFACRLQVRRAICFSLAHLAMGTKQVATFIPSRRAHFCCAVGFKCALARDVRQRYTSADGRTWLINDAVLEEVDNDLQRIVNCTKEGDRIAFNVTEVIQPSSLIIIPWQLALDTHVEDDSGSNVYPYATAKTRITCPRNNSGLFLVQ